MNPVRLFRPQGPHHLAVVTVEPSFLHPDRVMVQVARGATRTGLTRAAAYGPMTAVEAEARVAELVAALRAEGFATPGLQAVDELASPDTRTRALAAERLGWRRDPRAVEPLLALAGKPGDEQCAVVDALGRIGDARAVPLARQEAARKLLSRRRSGAEALRNLHDADGLAEVETRARQRLPGPLPSLLDQDLTVAAVEAVPLKDRGLALDTLYELDRAELVRDALAALPVAEPWLWRYAKSILKRSMLRADLPTFGRLAHRLERAAREDKGTRAELKSGRDGELRSTLVFGRSTRQYVQRACWRFLRRLASWRPELYADAAAEVLIHYTDADEAPPLGLFGAYARCHLLHRILWGRGSRYRFLPGSMRFRKLPKAPVAAAEDAREESFAELWDRHPRAYLRLLGASRLVVVQQFAYRAVARRHAAALQAAPPAQILGMLDAPYEPTVELALGELRRRFDPAAPDWALLAALVADPRPAVRALGAEWLPATASAWARDPEAAALLLPGAHPELRDLAVREAVRVLRDAPAAERLAVAGRLRALLESGEPAEGAHAGVSAVVREALLDVLEVPLEDLVRGLETGSPAWRSVAAALAVRRPRALDELGVPRVVALAKDEAVLVREAGFLLLERELARFEEDPWPLLAVAESPWPDARRRAVEIARRLELAHLSLDAIFEIVDSSREEVQGLGRELLLRSRERWSAESVIPRLLEHPAPGMRDFTLGLADAYLRAGIASVAAAPLFFHALFLDLAPRRSTKRQALDLLLAAGLGSESEARAAVAILDPVLRTRTRFDFEDVLAVVAQLQLAWPSLAPGLEAR